MKHSDTHKERHEEEIVYEEAPVNSLHKTKGAEVTALKERLKESEAKAKEYLDGWQRAKADMANAKKAENERLVRLKDSAVEEVLQSLLPALDSFDSAMHASAWQSIDSAWRQGMEFVYTQLLSGVEAHGAQSFGMVGDAFDPVLHEAAEGDGAHITKVLRKGYKVGERIIRPARVILG